jgi:ribulose-phosphate 3-epimerase
LDWLHLDIMDGNFVPEISFGANTVASLKKYAPSVGLGKMPFDTHLMVERPERHIARFAEAGSDWITIQAEAASEKSLAENIASIRALGRKAGLSISPETPVSAIEAYLGELDLLLVMTVEPGAGGQSLIRACLDKIRNLKKIREERGLSYLISADGGINAETAPLVKDAGLDVMVIGSALFRSPIGAVKDFVKELRA